MTRLILTLAMSFSSVAAVGQQRDDYVSDASYTIGTYQPTFDQHEPQQIAEAAQQLLKKLDDKQRDKISYALTSPERRMWTNLPARPNAGGLRLGDINQEQVRAVCDLMACLFSKPGYEKLRDIMLADDQLLSGGQPRPGFGTEEFSVVLFGEPSASNPWAFQLDGHHVGVNVTLEGKQLTMSPSFIGTQPQNFQIAGKKFRPLGSETDLAHKLAMSLTDEQVKQAVLKPQRGFIRVGPGRDGQKLPPEGVACSTFDQSQQETLMKLISVWVGMHPQPHAEKMMQQIREEIDQMRFSWNGGRKPGSDISYAIQGPSLIIEYACQDLGGKPLEHLHTIYRDPRNEYGGQLDRP